MQNKWCCDIKGVCDCAANTSNHKHGSVAHFRAVLTAFIWLYIQMKENLAESFHILLSNQSYIWAALNFITRFHNIIHM